MKASDLDEEAKTGSEDCEELPPYPPPYEQQGVDLGWQYDPAKFKEMARQYKEKMKKQKELEKKFIHRENPRTFLITGATDGIGLYTAKLLARNAPVVSNMKDKRVIAIHGRNP